MRALVTFWVLTGLSACAACWLMFAVMRALYAFAQRMEAIL